MAEHSSKALLELEAKRGGVSSTSNLDLRVPILQNHSFYARKIQPLLLLMLLVRSPWLLCPRANETRFGEFFSDENGLTAAVLTED
ncbi:hypothetical protein SASPL_131108 [Salvia splendens]|uniref:Uncharacterized protein n=1 Tax=Salvia splendens TaxID=180675 RepID=A0A8X8X5D3_SALSN|nr:hypothetical protein SASPL_131108 [Salvia splendens]